MPSANKGNISSVARRMMQIRMEDKSEKGLLVRIGTLVDAIVSAQRGSSNAPGSIQRKANIDNLKKPKPLTGSTENIFNGASIHIEPTDSSVNLSHYEVQVDSDPHFSNPAIKEIFTTGTTFKGLTNSTTYNIRIRPITKNGQIGDWADLDSITTTTANVSADFDGKNLGAQDISKSFTFNSSAQEVFCGTNTGPQSFTMQSFKDVNGQVASIPITDSEVIVESLRGTDVVEAVLLEGIAPTTLTVNSPQADSTVNFTFRRMPALVFFDLIDAATGATFPTSYTFTVKISLQGAAFTVHTGDTVWVEF